LRTLIVIALAGMMSATPLAEEGPAPEDAQAVPATRVVATYFHHTLRCQTCLNIEALARYAVTEERAADVDSGLLAWRSVDFDLEENAHFAEEYDLEAPTLVIAMQDGDETVRWVRLDKVWELYEDVEAFDRYVGNALEEYLDAASRGDDE